MKKKLFSAIILVVMICVGISVGTSVTYAFAAEQGTAEVGYFENQNRSIAVYDAAISSYKSVSVAHMGDEIVSYSDDFAGAYIDDEGFLNIGLVGSRNSGSSFNEQIRYRQHEFSYNYLQRIHDVLEPVMLDLSIYMLGINEKDNNLSVYLYNERNTENIISFLARHGFEKKAIDFVINDGITANNIAYGGESISAGGFRGTIAVNAIDNATGQLGILTNEHVVPTGTASTYRGHWNGSAFSANIALGTALRGQHTGTIDASFVPFATQANWEITPYGKYNTTARTNVRLGNNNQIVQGRAIRKIGQTTGVTDGTITHANTTAKLDYGTPANPNVQTIMNVFRYSNSSLGGDSGGPVYFNDGTDLHLIGINFAGPANPATATYGIACRIHNVMNTLDVTPITNDSFVTSNDGNGISIEGLNFNPAGSFNIPTAIRGRTVTKVGNSAFANQTQLSQITIPASVTHIGAGAFRPSTILANFEGNRADIDLAIASGTTQTYLNNGWTGFNVVELSASGPLTVVSGQLRDSFEIPLIFNNRTITTLGSNAFVDQTKLSQILIPASVTTIGNNAFANCTKLRTIVIPNTVTTMGANVFSGCPNIHIYTVAKSKPSGWQNNWASNRPVFWGELKQYKSDVITGFGYNGSTYYWNGALHLTVYDEADTYYNSSGMLVVDGGNSALTFDVRTVSSSNAFTSMSGDIKVYHISPNGTEVQMLNCSLNVNTLNNVTLNPSSFTLYASNLADGIHTIRLTSYVKRGSWDSNSTKTFTFEVNKRKITYDKLMEFGYQGSTYYWNGAIDMTTTNSLLYTLDSSNKKFTFTGITDLAFSIRTISSSNSFSAISGDVTFVMRNSMGQVVPIGGKSNFKCSVNVTAGNSITLGTPPFFVISTAHLPYGTYTLTLTSVLNRASWTDTDTVTYTFEKLEPACISEGSLITLANGSQVAVEDLTGDEQLLVWNMLTGEFDSAPILFIDSEPLAEYEITHLYFSDGTDVKVIYEHGFWDFDLSEYVFLRNDAAKYIGHWFNKQADDGNGNMIWTAVQLVDVDVYTEYTTAWSPVTFGHLCYYVNGMLSMPGATEGLINIFEVDTATMQYNAGSFASDIATYGLFTYEEFAAILPVPEIIFDAFNGQYLKVAMGKGLIDWETLVGLVEHYAGFF